MSLHQKILGILSDNGYQAYLVGGCVRDLLLGRTPKDYDVTTNARPEQVKELFPNSKLVGEHFGVILISEGEEQVEVATFRSDGVYKDSRHPESVEFTDNIYEDLKRRDFTMNAIAMDIHGNTICEDGCIEDLHSCVIRCVGDPAKRFEEDALRIMRAIRLSAQLHFVIEPETGLAIKKNVERLQNISKERIAIELNKLLVCDFSYERITLFPKYGLDKQLFGNIQGYEKFWGHTTDLYKGVYDQKNLHAKLAALFLYTSKSAVERKQIGYIEYPRMAKTSAGIAQRWMEEYKYSNHDISKVVSILKSVGEAQSLLEYRNEDGDPANKYMWKRLMRSTDFESVIDLIYSDRQINGNGDVSDAEYLRSIFLSYKSDGFFPKLLLTGDDLIKSGFMPGPHFGKILGDLEALQLNGDIKTKEEAEEWFKKNYVERI